jgi:hypothetical protein
LFTQDHCRCRKTGNETKTFIPNPEYDFPSLLRTSVEDERRRAFLCVQIDRKLEYSETLLKGILSNVNISIIALSYLNIEISQSLDDVVEIMRHANVLKVHETFNDMRFVGKLCDPKSNIENVIFDIFGDTNHEAKSLKSKFDFMKSVCGMELDVNFRSNVGFEYFCFVLDLIEEGKPNVMTLECYGSEHDEYNGHNPLNILLQSFKRQFGFKHRNYMTSHIEMLSSSVLSYQCLYYVAWYV